MRVMALIALVLLAAGALSSSLAQTTCEPCGPTYCKETAAYKTALVRRKADTGQTASWSGLAGYDLVSASSRTNGSD